LNKWKKINNFKLLLISFLKKFPSIYGNIAFLTTTFLLLGILVDLISHIYYYAYFVYIGVIVLRAIFFITEIGGEKLEKSDITD